MDKGAVLYTDGTEDTYSDLLVKFLYSIGALTEENDDRTDTSTKSN